MTPHMLMRKQNKSLRNAVLLLLQALSIIDADQDPFRGWECKNPTEGARNYAVRRFNVKWTPFAK